MNYLDEKEIALLSSEVEAAESNRNLTQGQLEVIYNKKLFNIFVPSEHGGLGCDLIQGIRIFEDLAKIDGSLGWTVTMCAGANMFIGYLDQFLAKMIFQDKKVCFSGSGEIGGVARETAKGYVINGQWNYIVGLPLCTIFTANCQIERDGKLCYNEDGSPLYSSFFFFPNEVEVLYDDHALGLVASAGHSFVIKDLEVIAKREFHISSKERVIDSLTYQFPFNEYSLLTLTANHLGMQSHFFEELLAFKDNGQCDAEVCRRLVNEFTAYHKLNRDKFYDLVQTAWEQMSQSGDLLPDLQNEIEIVCQDIVLKGRNYVHNIVQHLGMRAMQTNEPINRIVRDIVTASQLELLVKR